MPTPPGATATGGRAAVPLRRRGDLITSWGSPHPRRRCAAPVDSYVWSSGVPVPARSRSRCAFHFSFPFRHREPADTCTVNGRTCGGIVGPPLIASRDASTVARQRSQDMPLHCPRALRHVRQAPLAGGGLGDGCAAPRRADRRAVPLLERAIGTPRADRDRRRHALGRWTTTRRGGPWCSCWDTAGRSCGSTPPGTDGPAVRAPRRPLVRLVSRGRLRRDAGPAHPRRLWRDQRPAHRRPLRRLLVALAAERDPWSSPAGGDARVVAGDLAERAVRRSPWTPPWDRVRIRARRAR